MADQAGRGKDGRAEARNEIEQRPKGEQRRREEAKAKNRTWDTGTPGIDNVDNLTSANRRIRIIE
jgi:hypothetical protein